MNATCISATNMVVTITGALPSYIYTWRVLAYTPGNLGMDKNIRKFMVILEDL